MDASFEIRKLPASVIRELVEVLEYAECWKRLMAVIPKTLSCESYECKITERNLPKYKSEHFKMIESASSKTGRDCTEMLLDEWGTSGSIRPALGHLLYLLTKAELFRAADYVAVSLLKQPPPDRPKDGPAAPITTDLACLLKNGESVLGMSENYMSDTTVSDIMRFSSAEKNAVFSDLSMLNSEGGTEESAENLPRLSILLNDGMH